MHHLWVLVFYLMLLTAIAQNQPGYPLPDSLQIITVDNAAQLRPLASIGGEVMGDLAWSPNGKNLAVSTTGGVLLYNADNWDARPARFPGNRDVYFDYQGNLVSAGHVNNPVTGTTIQGVPETSPSDRLAVLRQEVNGEALVTLTDRATHQEMTLDTGLTGTINQVAFSSDEQMVVIQMSVKQEQASGSATLYPAAQLWDVAQNTLIAPLELNPAFDFFDIRFYAHGQRLVIASSLEINYEGPYALLQIWDSSTGQTLLTDEIPGSWIRISPDDNLLAYTAWDGLVLWSNQEIGILGSDRILFPVFSPDGRWLAGYREEGVFLWRINTATQLGVPDRALTECCIANVAFSPDGTFLAIYERWLYGDQMHLWNIESGETEFVSGSMAFPLQFSPDGRWILAKQQDSEQYALWDAQTGERLTEFKTPFVIDPAWTRAVQQLSPTAIQIISLPTGESVRYLRVIEDYLGETYLLDAAAGRVLFAEKAFNINDGQILFENHFAAPPPNYILSADWERILNPDRSSSPQSPLFMGDVRQTVDGRRIYEGGSTTPATDSFLTPNGELLGYITHYRDVDTYQPTSRLEFRSVETGEFIAEWVLPGAIETITFSHDHKLLALGSSDYPDGWLIFLDLSGDLGRIKPVIRSLHFPCRDGDTAIVNLVFSPEDNHVAASLDCQVGGDGLAHIYFVKTWDLQLLLTDSPLGEWFSHMIFRAYNPIFNTDASLLLVNPAHGFNDVLNVEAPELWDMTIRQKLVTLPGDAIAAFSPDDRLLALHDKDHIQLYDVAALRQGNITPIATIEDAYQPVRQVAFNPDGTQLYAMSENRLQLYGVTGE